MSEFLNKLFPKTELHASEFSMKDLLWSFVYTACFYLVFFIIQRINLDYCSNVEDLKWIVLSSYFVFLNVSRRFKLFCFTAVFFVSVFYVFNPVSALFLIAILLFALFVLRSKINWYLKLILLGGMMLFLIFMRLDYFNFPRLNIIIPYALSLLMFRLILLLYEVKHYELKGNFWNYLAYFFSFPNLSFLFFPVVDNNYFMKSFYTGSYQSIFRRGMKYIMFGILQLVLYKEIHNNFLFPQHKVHDTFTLVLFLAINYLLIIKITGILTLGLGFVMMFGFNLPTLFGNFFLASSFADYWRKVNTYWRAFVIKIVYYPLYFKIRKKIPGALFISVVVAFLFSYVFHSYQLFCINGSYSFKINDLLYWMILGVLIGVNVLREDNKVKNGIKENVSSVRIFLFKPLIAAIVFFTVSSLWFLWNSENLTEFIFTYKNLISLNGRAVIKIIILVFLFGIIYLFYSFIGKKFQSKFKLSSVQEVIAFLILIKLSLFAFNAKEFSKNSHKLISSVVLPTILNEAEKEKADVGYYETIVNSNPNNWEVNLKIGKRFNAQDKITKRSNTLLVQEFFPNTKAVLNGFTMTINSLGLRDDEYSLEKSPHTTRLALLGGSYELGSGVNDDKVFEKITEKKLNDLHKEKKVEIWNFSVGGYTAIQHLEILKNKALQSKPDVVLVFAHTFELKRFTAFFSRYISLGIDLKYDFLKQIKILSCAKQGMSSQEIKQRIAPFASCITLWAYSEIVSICKQNNIKAVWIFLPTTNDPLTQEELDKEKNLATKAGFETFVLDHVYDKFAYEKVALEETNPHPNEFGHQLIADKFYTLLVDSNNKIILNKK